MILWQIVSPNGGSNTEVLKAGSEVKCCGDHDSLFLLYIRIIIPEENARLAHLILVHAQS